MTARSRLAKEAAYMTVSYFVACLKHLTLNEVCGEQSCVGIAAELHGTARRYGTAFGFEGVLKNGAVRHRLTYDAPGLWL